MLPTLTKLLWTDKTAMNPGVLVSSSYPFYYPTGVIYVWIMFFQSGLSAYLFFSDISLNKYDVEVSVCTFLQCI